MDEDRVVVQPHRGRLGPVLDVPEQEPAEGKQHLQPDIRHRGQKEQIGVQPHVLREEVEELLVRPSPRNTRSV